jgi:hypothetical protein
MNGTRMPASSARKRETAAAMTATMVGDEDPLSVEIRSRSDAYFSLSVQKNRYHSARNASQPMFQLACSREVRPEVFPHFAVRLCVRPLWRDVSEHVVFWRVSKDRPYDENGPKY